MKDLLVSIDVCTYNQKKYIRECIESILAQKTKFDIEILIHDDASTDGTAEIIKEYELKYPNIIKPIYQLENQYSKNVRISATFQYSRAQGKYIAQCEGDDYWCDEYKLQKQVDFMESHPDYALCYHPARMIFENEDRPDEIICRSKKKNPQSFEKLLRGNTIPSNSVMYRAEYLKAELDNYPRDIYPPDWFTHTLVATHGKIGYLPDVMYVYRRNEQGISYTKSKVWQEEIHPKYGLKELRFHYEIMQRVKDNYPKYYEEVFSKVLKEVVVAYAKNGKMDELKKVYEIYSDELKDINVVTIKHNPKDKKKIKKYKKLYKIFLITTICLFVLSVILILM